MAAGDEPRIVATFDSYDGMLAAIRERVTELQIHGERFDAFSGLPDGYLSKLIGANPIRKIGMVSMAPVLSGLGLKCQFIEDSEGTARLKNHVAPRNPAYVRTMPADAGITLTARMLKRIRRLGGQARMAQMTAKQRSALARKAALARWRKANP
jgi:hypothetical protein